LLVAVSDACRGGWLNAGVSCPSACGPAWLAPAGVLANGVDLRKSRLSVVRNTRRVLCG
jgi:hypothetical protein